MTPHTLKMNFCLIRNGMTATSISISIMDLNVGQRVVWSIMHGHRGASGRYHHLAIADNLDISATDFLEETTGGVTGIIYDVVNKREVTGSHLELELEEINGY